jgi:uncharacterized membrane protein YdjX (TVP38/TMEM64 family)
MGRFLRRYGLLMALAALMAGIFMSGLHQHLTLDELARQRLTLKEALHAYPVTAIAAYVFIYALAVALSLPGATFFTVAGGWLFGGWIGGVLAVCGATLGAIGVFLIARTALSDHLTRRLGPFMQRLAAGFEEDAASYLLFLRLVPLFPFWLVNLAPAAFNVRLPIFAWTTFIGILPGALAFAFVGAGLDSILAARQADILSCEAAVRIDCNAQGLELSHLLTPSLLAAFIALGVLALVPVVAKRFLRIRSPAKDQP